MTPDQISSYGFTVSWTGRVNALITDVEISQGFDPAATQDHPVLKKFKAIWDTGATGSCISERVATECGLVPIGVSENSTAGGILLSNRYLVNIYLPNRVAFQEHPVSEVRLLGADVLIGMDVIGLGDFVVTNFEGKTTMCFRYPSIEKIDFLAQKKPFATTTGPITHRNDFSEVGRNDPCPCGSGKKFKKCCGAS